MQSIKMNKPRKKIPINLIKNLLNQLLNKIKYHKNNKE